MFFRQLKFALAVQAVMTALMAAVADLIVRQGAKVAAGLVGGFALVAFGGLILAVIVLIFGPPGAAWEAEQEAFDRSRAESDVDRNLWKWEDRTGPRGGPLQLAHVATGFVLALALGTIYDSTIAVVSTFACGFLSVLGTLVFPFGLWRKR